MPESLGHLKHVRMRSDQPARGRFQLGDVANGEAGGCAETDDIANTRVADHLSCSGLEIEPIRPGLEGADNRLVAIWREPSPVSIPVEANLHFDHPVQLRARYARGESSLNLTATCLDLH